MSELEELKKQNKELVKRIAELEAEKLRKNRGVWKPGKGDEYFTVQQNIHRRSQPYRNVNTSDIERQTSFAVFPTELECRDFCNTVEAIAELRQWQRVFGRGNYTIIDRPNYGWDTMEIQPNSIHVGFTEAGCRAVLRKLTANCHDYLSGRFQI